MDTPAKIETVSAVGISPEVADEIAALQASVWPNSKRKYEDRRHRILNEWQAYKGPAVLRPRFFLIREAEQLVATAHVFPREVITSEGNMTVLGLAGVCASPEHRGKHLGRAVVLAGFEIVDQGHFPYSLFQTSVDVRPFYEKLRATKVDNRFFNSLGEDPDANPFWDTEIMRYPDRPGWPEGPIDLLGAAY